MRLSGRRRAFTLVEILMSMAVSAMILGALLSALVSAARYTEYLADRRKAINRIAAVEAFLRLPAAYCGFGVPSEPDRYRAAFGNLPYEPFNWEGPISTSTAEPPLTGAGDSRVDGVLYIAYALRSSCRASGHTVLDKENDAMRLDQSPGKREIEANGSPRPGCKSFVCFGSSLPPGNPLRVKAAAKSDVLLSAADARSVTVLKDDRMWLFRAMAVFSSGDRLYSYDHSGSGRQPRLSGICDLRFRVDGNARKLVVYIMARGDKRYGGRRRDKEVGEWPEEYRADSFKNRENYLLVVEKIVLELPNYQPAGIFGAESAVEAF